VVFRWIAYVGMDILPLRTFSNTSAGRASSRAGRPAPRRPSRAELVAQVDDFLRDNINEPITVGDLSRMAGVSERTLRSAFHDVLGISPKQWALRQRLAAAHEALSNADPTTTTVTEVAMSYGFFELGRFAGRYRSAFGEMPSETLHNGIDAWSDRAAC
jgi:transcriptional regulator GlxA family with amidase domain